MKLKFSIIILTLIFISCNNSNNEVNDNKLKEHNKLMEIQSKLLNELPKFILDTFIDERDSKKYLTIKIGNQIWTKGIIKFNSTNGHIYRNSLYNWEAANNACPNSFKIPSEKDWSDLFQYIHDSIIKKSSPKLIEKLSRNLETFECNECKEKHRNANLPREFRLDKTISKLDNYDFMEIINIREDEMVLMFLYLERIGFCTSGSGFKYNGGLGVDDYSYFWTSTIDNSGNHKYIPIYTGDYCRGCGYRFEMPYNNKFGFNLKCIKSN